LAESAVSEIVGKDSPFIEPVRGICANPSYVYSDSPDSVQGFSDIFLSPLMRSKKRLNKIAKNGMFILKGNELPFST
jgi:hypothetical protein